METHHEYVEAAHKLVEHVLMHAVNYFQKAGSPSPQMETHHEYVEAAHKLVEHVLMHAVNYFQKAGSPSPQSGMDSSVIDEYASLAHSIVDNVIDSALEHVLHANCREAFIPEPAPKRNLNLKPSKEKLDNLFTGVPNITWPTILEFTPKLGEEKILEYIKYCWSYGDFWLYCIDLIGKDDKEYDCRYRYRVRWSIPTRRTPIPRATASVYFTIDVSTIKPKNYTVDVFYIFEANRLVHRPGIIRFEEKWLKDILECKISLMKMIDF